MKRLILAAAIAAAFAAPAAAHQDDQGRLEARAILPADATWPAPFGAVTNQDPAPAPGSVQPVGGFSALLDGGNGTFWAMPDNGFGSKANSRSFLLRVYKVRPHFETSDGGPGTVTILDSITLRDPDLKVRGRSSTRARPTRHRVDPRGQRDVMDW